MTDAVPAPAKTKKAKKPKAPSSHPKYSDMVVNAISGLKEKGGSSRQAILKYVMANNNVGKDGKVVSTHLKMALKRGVAAGTLVHTKGTGASGSFRLSSDKKEGGKKAKVSKKVKKPRPAKTAVKKPKAKKPAKPKKAPAKKPKSPKKAAPKKTAAKKPKPKKVTKKSPKKAAAKKAKK